MSSLPFSSYHNAGAQKTLTDMAALTWLVPAETNTLVCPVILYLSRVPLLSVLQHTSLRDCGRPVGPQRRTIQLKPVRPIDLYFKPITIMTECKYDHPLYAGVPLLFSQVWS